MSLSRRHVYKLPDTHNANKRDRSDRYWRVNRVILPFDTNGSEPGLGYAENSQEYAAYLADAVHGNNRAG
jgi:hypothetical protein